MLLGMSALAGQPDISEHQLGRAFSGRAARVADNPPALETAGRSRPVRLIILFGVLLIVAIAVVTCLLLSNLRSRALTENEREIQNIALVLAKQMERDFDAVVSVQANLIERIRALGIASGEDFEQKMSDYNTHLLLKNEVVGISYLGAFILVNSQGKAFNFSRSWPIPDINAADRDYFTALQSDEKLNSFVTKPFRNRATGTWIVQIARKVSGPNGEFLGLVLGAIELQSIEQYFARVSLGPDSAIALVHRDGELMARHPHVESSIGRPIPGGLAVKLVSNSDHGVGRRIGVVGNPEDRLIAAHRVDHYPFLIVATTNVAAVLADWWRMAYYLIGIAALAILAVAAGTFLVIRQFKNHASLERARAEKIEAEILREQTLRLDAALENMSQGLVMFDSEARLVVCNDHYLEICKLPPDLVKPGCTFLDILKYRAANGSFSGNPEEYVGDLLAAIAKGKTESREIKTADGRIISVMNQPMAGGGWVATHEDITERKQAEAQIYYIARHDQLTGIANRAVLHEKLEESLARLRRRQEPFSILMLDLDGFKYINDTLGHTAGDKLLNELAQRLQFALCETDVLARLGGDEFAIIQSGETDQREGAVALALKVLEIVAQPFDLDGHNLTVATSIGIALAPEDGTDAGELLQKADCALYWVKSEGRNNFCFFNATMSKGASERLQLLSDMRAALTRKEFELCYQPIFDAKTRRPCGVEALVRWRHPVHGLMSSDRFIPLAEETSLMEPLGNWILERACNDAATWPEHIKVAVNLSAMQFRSGKLFDVILCALVDSGLPPERLELEITESVLMQNAERYGVVIQQLKNLGISIALDDFGTGYSSLSYLTTFPFDKIKIDKSFTQGLSSRADCAAIVASVLTLARGLDMVVTAEGVETKQQFELLRAAGVHQIQGYLFARPSPLAELNFTALEQRGQAVEAA